MKLNCVILSIGDVEQLGVAADWYEQKLGLTRTSVNEGESVWFDLGNGSELGVHTGERLGNPKRVTITFDVYDVDVAMEELNERGVVFEGPPENKFWGRRAVTHDPTGHTIYISSPPRSS